MMSKIILKNLFFLLFIVLTFLKLNEAYARQQENMEADQQMSDFSLAGYGDKGKKSWELSGKSADIFTNEIKLKEVVGNLYGEKEDVKLTAEKGVFDRKDGLVRMEQNVTITTSTGAKLTTDTLNWDKKNQIVSTKDAVNIEKDNMVTTAQGATGRPDLKEITLEKDVKVELDAAEKQGLEAKEKNRIEITCDGPLLIEYEKNMATFNNNVKVDRQDMQIYSDIMEVYFNPSDKEKKTAEQGAMPMGGKIDKIVARKHVRIVRGENISYSDEATYTAADKKITLSGRPKLIIYTEEGDNNAPFGN